MDGKEPKCNGESEPRRRGRRALNFGGEKGRDGCVVRHRGMKNRTQSFYEELRSFSEMSRICCHASAHFAKMT